MDRIKHSQALHGCSESESMSSNFWTLLVKCCWRCQNGYFRALVQYMNCTLVRYQETQLYSTYYLEPIPALHKQSLSNPEQIPASTFPLSHRPDNPPTETRSRSFRCGAPKVLWWARGTLCNLKQCWRNAWFRTSTIRTIRFPGIAVSCATCKQSSPFHIMRR